jgi:hypothetical protein
MSGSRTAWPPRRRLQECLEFRQRGRVLEQEQVPSVVAAQLGSADARCDRGTVVDRRDPVVVAVPDQGRAGDRAEAVPDVMARARLELGRAGGCGGRVPLIVASGGQAVGQRAIGGVCLQPTLVPAAVRQLELRRGSRRAAALLRAEGRRLTAVVARALKVDRYNVAEILRMLIERSEELQLYVRGNRRDALRYARWMLERLTGLYSQGETPHMPL